MSFKFKELTRQLAIESEDPVEVTCNIVDFADKTIVSILRDGEMNVSYDIQLPKMNDRRSHYMDDEEAPDDLIATGIIPTVLVGGHYDIKCQAVASQIAKLLSAGQSKPLILNMSGMFFKDGQFKQSDFTKLQFLVKLTKDVSELSY